MTTKVVKGTVWMLVGLIVPIGFSFFATPIVTRLLGAESYGLFVLILLIPAYFSFGDFGMNMASTRFGSAAFAEHDAEKEARVVRTAAVIVLLGSLPIAIALALFARYIVVSFFNIPDHLVDEATLALRITSITYVVNLLTGTFNTPQLTRLRMDLNIMITSGVRLAGVFATPIVVYLGGGVVGAVVVALSVSVFTLVGHLIFSSRLLPELRGFSIDRPSIRPMIKFGGALVVAGIAGVLLANLEKFVLTKVTSVETLAYYSVATTVAAMLTLFSGSISQSIMPAFSQLQAESERNALNMLYSRGIRLTHVWVIPTIVFMVFVGEPFFTYWFGPDFGRESTVPYYITIVGLLFNVLAYFPFSAIMASGRSDILAKIYWIELAPYALLVWVLASNFGAKGAAAAYAIRVWTDAALLFWLARKVGGVTYLQENFRFSILGFAVMAIPVFALFYFGTISIVTLSIAFVCTAFYAFIALTRIVQPEEIAWLKGKFSGNFGFGSQ